MATTPAAPATQRFEWLWNVIASTRFNREARSMNSAWRPFA